MITRMTTSFMLFILLLDCYHQPNGDRILCAIIQLVPLSYSHISVALAGLHCCLCSMNTTESRNWQDDALDPF